MTCQCSHCNFVSVFPEIPSLDPPDLDTYLKNPNTEWTLLCNWLSPWHEDMAFLFLNGFTTDGASIPSWAKSIVGDSFQLPLLPYAIVHDGIYCAELLPQQEADDYFYSLMRSRKHVSYPKAQTIYRAVQIGGGTVWKKHTKESINNNRKLVIKITDENVYNLIVQTRIIPQNLETLIIPLS